MDDTAQIGFALFIIAIAVHTCATAQHNRTVFREGNAPIVSHQPSTQQDDELEREVERRLYGNYTDTFRDM